MFSTLKICKTMIQIRTFRFYVYNSQTSGHIVHSLRNLMTIKEVKE